MNELVKLNNSKVVTTSLKVAETFNKEHKHVLRDIRELLKDVSKNEQMFFEGNSPDSYGRDRKIYYINRDGFTLLAMGFTGKKVFAACGKDVKQRFGVPRYNELRRQDFEAAIGYVSDWKPRQLLALEIAMHNGQLELTI